MNFKYVRTALLALGILLPCTMISQFRVFGQFRVSARGGIARYAPLLPPTFIPMPPQYALRVGIGVGGIENQPFIGAVAIALLPMKDTFHAEGYVDQWWNTVPATGHRTTHGFGIHLPVNLRIYETGFFTAYGGLSVGLIVGSSTYSYTDQNGNEVIPASGYPDAGKAKIRAYPGAFDLGCMYEFEKFIPYAEAGFTFTGITDVPGMNVGWYTLEAGILWPLN